MGRAGEKPLRRWVVPPERVAAMRARSLVGPSYSIGISLLDGGATDQIGEQSVDLIAYFTPTDGGERIMSMGVRTVSMATPIIEPGR
jgi:hypothetical protein